MSFLLFLVMFVSSLESTDLILSDPQVLHDDHPKEIPPNPEEAVSSGNMAALVIYSLTLLPASPRNLAWWGIAQKVAVVSMYHDPG